MKNEVRKPGKWWVVRLRQVKTYDQVACVLTCSNAYHAGHNGWSRKYRLVRSKIKTVKEAIEHGYYKRVRKFKNRQWKLNPPSQFRLAYRFADLADARAGARTQVVKKWIEKHEGFVEILEVEGCLVLSTITSEKAVHRMFAKGTNEMVILALEAL